MSEDQSWTVSIHPQVIKFIGKHLSPEDQVRVLDFFDRLESYGTGLGRPYTRLIEGKLWELRPQTTRGTWRFLYIVVPERRFCVVVTMRKRARIRVVQFSQQQPKSSLSLRGVERRSNPHLRKRRLLPLDAGTARFARNDMIVELNSPSARIDAKVKKMAWGRLAYFDEEM